MSQTGSDPDIPKIVVIILTYNQREKTLTCLARLFATHQQSLDVLVWDNGSQDATREAVQDRYPATIYHHHHANLGVAGGRNAAAELAIRELQATHLLFLDNDILVEPGFVEALYSPLCENRKVGQTQAKLRFIHDPARINDGGGAKINFVLWRIKPVGYNEIDRGQHDLPKNCISCGGAMMVRADIFQQLDGFDPLFGPFGPEDLDFSLRLQKAGYQALYIPQAVGYHEVSHTFGKGYSEDYARHKSRHWLMFMKRHASARQKLGFYLFGAPYLAITVILRESRKGNWKAIRGLWTGIVKPKMPKVIK
jgi:GT2 family glycosyltransferase